MYMYHDYYVNVDFHNCSFPNELSMSQLIYTSTSINIIVAGNHVTQKQLLLLPYYNPQDTSLCINNAIVNFMVNCFSAKV